MPKAKKTKPKTKKIKAKQVTKGKKRRSVDEIMFPGVIFENFKTDVPNIQHIKISSNDFEMDIELPISLIESIEENYNFFLQEKSELFIMMSRDEIKQEFAMLLGKCIIYDVGQKYFLGSMGGLTVKLNNLSDNVKLFPLNSKINVAFFKSLEDLQK
jgi:hypothetical protein